jgi:hypothetical protein
MTNKFRFWVFRLHYRPHKVYFFELSIKFYIKSSPKTLKLVNFPHGSEKGAKKEPDGICSRSQEYKKTPVIPIPSVIQK